MKDRDIKKNTDNVTIKGFSYNDPSVPAGWGIKLRSQGPHYPPKKSFCDPLGLIFMSKREAYEYMVKSGEYGDDDKALMRMIHKKPSESKKAVVSTHFKDEQQNTFMKSKSSLEIAKPCLA